MGRFRSPGIRLGAQCGDETIPGGGDLMVGGDDRGNGVEVTGGELIGHGQYPGIRASTHGTDVPCTSWRGQSRWSREPRHGMKSTLRTSPESLAGRRP